ncbi:MAG: 3-phosphoshikimate 1-carboxyvinyltransferase [Dehalococcoidia bacterium]|nr:3-phosphoshikimate 1-carboxyvinyltransferase [Dehalococcoidia bacterium]
MNKLVLNPIKHIAGELHLPGSKSLSNRLLLLSAISKGNTEVYNVLDSDDTSHMLNALTSLGIKYDITEDKTTCLIHGTGGPFSVDKTDLYLGNAGTAVRPLCAVLCAGVGTHTIRGDQRMYERPIKDLVDALQQLGSDIKYLANDGFPPLIINANGIKGGQVNIKGNISSQYLTAMLLASPLSQLPIQINVVGELVSKPYIDMTLSVMKQFGVNVVNNNYESFEISGGDQYISPKTVLVEGDASSASYFMAAAAIGGGPIRLRGVGAGSVQGDVQVAEVLTKMGAKVTMGTDWIEVERNTLSGVDLDLNHIPDAAMTIATTALFANGPTIIRNIGNWRVKETDRLSAMATELRKVGAEVLEGEDYLEISPPDKILPATIDTYNDHRMAMCFSLAALGDSPITINDPACVSKTFPDYFELFSSLYAE